MGVHLADGVEASSIWVGLSFALPFPNLLEAAIRISINLALAFVTYFYYFHTLIYLRR